MECAPRPVVVVVGSVQDVKTRPKGGRGESVREACLPQFRTRLAKARRPYTAIENSDDQ